MWKPSDFENMIARAANRFPHLFLYHALSLLTSCLVLKPVLSSGTGPVPSNQWIASIGGCSKYCEAMMEVCPHSIFPSYGFQTLEECQEVCPLYPVTGQDNAFWGDSFECRFNHVGYLVSQQLPAEAHCPHASANGGGTCVGGTGLEK